jgi:hypothetical protein
MGTRLLVTASASFNAESGISKIWLGSDITSIAYKPKTMRKEKGVSRYK